MAITKTELDAKLDLVVSYIGSGSYQSARQALLQAEAILVGLPDYAIGNRRLSYRDQISSLMTNLDKLDSVSTSARKNRRVFATFTRE